MRLLNSLVLLCICGFATVVRAADDLTQSQLQVNAAALFTDAPAAAMLQRPDATRNSLGNDDVFPIKRTSGESFDSPLDGIRFFRRPACKPGSVPSLAARRRSFF